MNTYEILSFHAGRQHNLEQAIQIQMSHESFRHITGLYFSNTTINRWKLISKKMATSLSRRSSILEKKFVDTYPWPEIKLLLRRKFGERLSYNPYVKRNYAFQKWILQNYHPPKICIGFDTCSWEIFEKWKGKSFLILDLSIALPQYKFTLAKESKFSNEMIDKLTQDDGPVYDIYEKEIELADLILCGSEFVLKSCLSQGVNPDKLFILPYGIDQSKFYNPHVQPQTEKIKVVFIGSVNFRKGADIVLQSWKNIVKEFPFAELHFYGVIDMEIQEQLDRVFFHGFMPQDMLIQELMQAHISVLPSFFEGSSLAIYQSMCIGLAVVTTPNAGSIIENDRNGFLINYGSDAELTNKLKMLLENISLRKRLAFNAITDVKEYTWDNYGKKLNNVLKTILDNSGFKHVDEIAFQQTSDFRLDQ